MTKFFIIIKSTDVCCLPFNLKVRAYLTFYALNKIQPIQGPLKQMDGIETKCCFSKRKDDLGISEVIEVSLPNLNDKDFRL